MKQITADRPVEGNNQEVKKDDRYTFLKSILDQFSIWCFASGRTKARSWQKWQVLYKQYVSHTYSSCSGNSANSTSTSCI